MNAFDRVVGGAQQSLPGAQAGAAELGNLGELGMKVQGPGVNNLNVNKLPESGLNLARSTGDLGVMGTDILKDLVKMKLAQSPGINKMERGFNTIESVRQGLGNETGDPRTSIGGDSTGLMIRRVFESLLGAQPAQNKGVL